MYGDPEIVLECPQKDFEALYEALESRAKFVKVNKQALQLLLLDHVNCLQKLDHINKEDVKNE